MFTRLTKVTMGYVRIESARSTRLRSQVSIRTFIKVFMFSIAWVKAAAKQFER